MGDRKISIDLPDQMKYDSHNRLTEYIVTEDRKVRLLYDPVGRVFRKEIYDWVSEAWELEKAVHYYYQGGRLMQEYEVTVVSETEAQAEIEWDYLRGAGGRVIRKRETDGETVTDTMHINSPLGTTMIEVSPDMDAPVLKEGGYITSAEGEPFWVAGLEPQEENHIQYHGGFLEDKEFHTSEPGVERGYFYRMGVRHYSPMLGRFLQRDPLTQTRPGMKSSPLSANPYIYAHNKPTQMSDTSGYSPVPGGVSDCPGCLNPFGGGGLDGGGGLRRSPFINLGGGSGGTGGGGTDEEEVQCIKYSPEECINDDRYPDRCQPACCLFDNQPAWAGCCEKAELPFENICKVSTEGDCLCACCWGDDSENQPANIGGGSLGKGGGTATFGPPNLGPWGDGGHPWEFGPIPFNPLSYNPTNALNLNPKLGLKNSVIQSNTFNSYTPLGIFSYRKSEIPSTMGLMLAPIIGGIAIIGAVWSLLAGICWAHGRAREIACGADRGTHGCKYDCTKEWMDCICSACAFMEDLGFSVLFSALGIGLMCGFGGWGLPLWLAGALLAGAIAAIIGFVTAGLGCLLRFQ